MIASQASRLIDQVAGIRQALNEVGIHLTDMSRAGSLELGLANQADLAHAVPDAESIGPVEIVRLEGPIRARPVNRAAPGASKFRYFLDGSQKSIPVGRIDLDPIVAAFCAAGVLYRDDYGQPRLLGETLKVNKAWIVPTSSANDSTLRLVEELMALQAQVHNPFTTLDGIPLDVEVGNYDRTLRLAFDLAGKLRAREEQLLVDDWKIRLAEDDPDSWLVIDGPLRGDTHRAVGLVKSLHTQQLKDHEAVALFNLPVGHRTTAFRYATASGAGTSHGKTMWYMRFWPAEGLDARHSLVRIETNHEIQTTEDVDEIASWLLAERLPRATDDPRWPTLLYPIHYLERILKRRMAALTIGWPST